MSEKVKPLKLEVPTRAPDFVDGSCGACYWWAEMIRARGQKGKVQKLYWDVKANKVGTGRIETHDSKSGTGTYLQSVNHLSENIQKRYMKFLGMFTVT